MLPTLGGIFNTFDPTGTKKYPRRYLLRRRRYVRANGEPHYDPNIEVMRQGHSPRPFRCKHLYVIILNAFHWLSLFHCRN